MSDQETFGIGLYSVADASRLLRTPARTVSSWVRGYVRQLRSGPKAYAPVLPRAQAAFLTFADLVELMYVRQFRIGGVPLGQIRDVSVRFRMEWNQPYPLATKRFATDGRKLLLNETGAWRGALDGQAVAFDDLVSQLVHVGDLASEWRPLGRERAVLLNPERAFGRPVEDRSGAQTYLISTALLAGDSAEQVAWWYGTSLEAIQDCGRFEAQFHATAS